MIYFWGEISKRYRFPRLDGCRWQIVFQKPFTNGGVEMEMEMEMELIGSKLKY